MYNGYGVNAVVPDEGPGTVDVRVVTPYGESAITPADEFTFVPGPFVIGLQTAPYGSTTTNLDGPLTGGASVTIRGIHLADATAVNFGNTPVTTVTFTSYDVSDDDYGAITVASPPSSVAGIVNLTVTSPEGTSPTTPDATFSYAPIPTISGISPASGALAGGNEVAISGTGLGFVTAVDFGGAAASSFGVDGNTLYVDSPAGAALGAVDVTVTTSGGTVTDPSAFTYVPPPVLTGLSVASGAFEGGTPVVITGVDLGDATEVDFGQNPNTGDGNPATILANTDSQIEVVSPQSPTDDAGTFDVTVTTPDGTTAITEPADEFTYTDAPYIAQVSGPLTLNGQAAGYTAGGDTVDITGNDLDGATAVYFGNAPAASFGYDAYGDIVAVSPPGVVGTVDITVTTPVGTSDISPADEYTYVEAPVVSSVSPSLGPLGGGTQVTISGSGLANATGLNFGSLQTYGFTITSDTDTQIVATTPAYSAGTFDVTVVTQYGTSAISPADQFSYEGPPVISGQNVASGSVYGGTLVTISGVSLSAATVDFGSNAATVLSGLSSDSQLVVLSPEASGDAAGPVDVTVTTSYGTATETNGFTYALPPAVTSIFQSTGPTTGGTDVTIYGTNLAGASAVDFGGVPSAYVSENGDGSLTAVSPAGEPSTVDVTVVAPGGTTPTLPADQFTYLPLPVVAAVSPAAGTINGGTTITISGVGLGGATSIDFIDSQGDDYQAAIQSDSDNTLVVTSPDYGFATTVDITVTTAGGTSATFPADQFNYVYVPTVSSISPTSGLRTGGDTVSIYGTGLADVTSVAFGGAGPIHDKSRWFDHRDQSSRQRRHGGRDGGDRRRVVAHLRRRPVHLSPARPRRYGREPGGRRGGGRRNGNDQRHGPGQRQRSRFQRCRGYDCHQFGHGHADHGRRPGRHARDRGHHGDHQWRHVGHHAGRPVYGHCRAGSLVDRGGSRPDGRRDGRLYLRLRLGRRYGRGFRANSGHDHRRCGDLYDCRQPARICRRGGHYGDDALRHVGHVGGRPVHLRRPADHRGRCL